MGHLLTNIHPHDVTSIGRINAIEAAVHLFLGTEGFDDAQTAKRFLHLTHRIAPQGLRFDTPGLELASHQSHEPTEKGHENNGENRQLPRQQH